MSEQQKRIVKIAVSALGAVAAVFLIATCPIPGLSYQATAVLGILVMAIVWWITGILPEFVTAVVMAVLFVVVAGISTGSVFSTFASSTWWLLLSAFTLGVGMKKSGLMKRIALAIVNKFPRTFRCQVIAQLVTGTVLGPLIPSLAVKGAMLAPLAMNIGDELGYERQGRQATGLFAAMLVGIRTVAPTIVSASVTGYALMATLPADVQEQFNMATWFVAALPWLIVVLVLNYFAIMALYKPRRGEAAEGAGEAPGENRPGDGLPGSATDAGAGVSNAEVGALGDKAAGLSGDAHKASSAAKRGLSERLGVAGQPASGSASSRLPADMAGTGPFTPVEKRMLGIILVTVVLWATEPFHHVSAMSVGLVALVAMFVLKVIDVPSFKSGMNWTSLLFIGIALGLGSVFAEAGLNDWVMSTCGPVFQLMAGNPYVLVLGIGVITVVLRFLIVSEVAYLNLLMAFLVPMAASVGVNPWVLGFSAYALVIAWFAKYQSPIYLAAFYAVDGKMAKHSELAKYCGVYLAICLVGLAVSVPYWQWMGLL